MAQFFIGTPNRMELFGALHLSLLIVTAVLGAAIFFGRDLLKKLANQKTVRFILASVLLANMSVHYLSKIILGIWDYRADLPFHLCFITNFFLIYILFSDNHLNLYRVVFFFTFVGPLPAMIWSDLDYSWDSYTFYQFVISHHFMILCSLYCLFVLGYKVKFSGTIPAFIIGNSWVIAMAVFNGLFDTNYVMISDLPEQLYEIYPFISAFPPVFWLELVGILALIVSYLPAFLINRLSENTHDLG